MRWLRLTSLIGVSQAAWISGLMGKSAPSDFSCHNCIALSRCGGDSWAIWFGSNVATVSLAPWTDDKNAGSAISVALLTPRPPKNAGREA